MEILKILIIEDNPGYSSALKRVFEAQIEDCEVRILNPHREIAPTFDDFFHEIDGDNELALLRTVVLLDHNLEWRWTGANLAPSLCNVISISSEEVEWSKTCFRKKQLIAEEGDAEATEELIDMITRVAAPFWH